MKQLKPLLFSFFILSLGLISLFQLSHQDKNVSALDSDFSNGITVDSTLDTPDNNIGDGICDDGDGNCTLRAAIEEANSDPDASVIEFSIAGPGVHTIQPSPALPMITTQISIDGYSQPGSARNTAISPQPFNGTLTIEIDGSNLPESETNYNDGTCLSVEQVNNVEIKGLVINQCGNDGIHLDQSDFVKIQGNYIGTDPEGLLDEGNGRDHTVRAVGYGVYSGRSNNFKIGGSEPEERNIISGNQAGDIFWGNEGNDPHLSENNVVQGNYVGLGADGETPLPSGHTWGQGNALLFGNSHNDLIGGDGPGEGNVIATSYEYGIGFRDGSSGTVIQGNYIGTDYTGTQALTHAYGTGHPSAGIHVGAVSILFPGAQPHDVLIGGTSPGARNIIGGNTYNGPDHQVAGVNINDGAYNVTVENNYIGTDSSSSNSVPNDYGIQLNTYDELQTYNNVIKNNLISGNIIDGVSITGSGSQSNTVIGNSIHANGGLGLSLTGSNGSSAVTYNDPLDPDTGANNLLNFPEYTNVQEASGNTTVDYQLDVPAGDYRIEYFANMVPDPSGHGEGETYLGFQNVTSAGAGIQTFSHTLIGVTGASNLAMTTTEIDNSSDGFGATSEFGGDVLQVPPVSDTSITKTLTNPQDIAIGATANYQITYTNNGPDNADLSGFGGVLASTGLFYDFVPPDLINPSGYLADGPFPGTSFINVGNPDLLCLYGTSGIASAFNLTTDPTKGIIVCWLTASDTTLEPGSSITANVSFEVAPDSDLVFTNYVVGFPPEDDPDSSSFSTAFNSGYAFESLVSMQQEDGDSVNNFASAAYPVPVEPDGGDNSSSSTSAVGSSDGLSSTGQNIFMLLISGATLVLLSIGLSKKRLKT